MCKHQFAVLGVLATVVACTSVVESPARDRSVPVALAATDGGVAQAITVSPTLALSDGPVTARAGTRCGGSLGGGRVLVSSFETDNDRQLQVLDRSSLRVVRTLLAPDLERAPASIADVSLGYLFDCAIDTTVQRVFVVASGRAGVPAVAVVDVRTSTISQTIDSVESGGAVVGMWRGDSVLFVAGSRPAGRAAVRQAYVWILSLRSLAMRDSIPLRQGAGYAGLILSAIPFGVADSVAVQQAGHVHLCTPMACRAVAVVGQGKPAFDRARRLIVVPDPGTRFGPGSGALSVIDPRSGEAQQIPLPPSLGAPAVSVSVLADSASRRWVVAGGTLFAFSLFGFQPPTITSINPDSLAATQVRQFSRNFGDLVSLR